MFVCRPLCILTSVCSGHGLDGALRNDCSGPTGGLLSCAVPRADLNCRCCCLWCRIKKNRHMGFRRPSLGRGLLQCAQIPSPAQPSDENQEPPFSQEHWGHREFWPLFIFPWFWCSLPLECSWSVPDCPLWAWVSVF